MIRIPLYNAPGTFALIDDCDAHLALLSWSAAPRKHTVYAQRRDGRRLHRAVLGATDPTVEVDHVNGDGLDCRRENLRLASHAQNQQNQPKRGGRSRFKGVIRFPGCLRWHAQLSVRNHNVKIGPFDSEEEAAHAYDEAVRLHRGGFGRFNFPREGERAA